MSSTEPPESRCKTCAFFSEAILKTVRGEAIDEHIIRLVASFDTSCATCKYVLDHFAQIAPNSPLRPTCPMRLDAFPQKRFFFRTECGCWDHSGHHLELLPSPELAPTSVHYKTIDPDKIDVGSLKRWPEYCEEHHHNCRPDPSQAAVKNITLIDVQEHCLVQLPTTPKYTTLSYVWGVFPDILETRTSNFASLQLPNALQAPDVLDRLPRTIQDAIKVTQEMGERYLWVDRLCIIQDDEANKAQQIASMASIYANSQFTIIAADGANANSGLLGVDIPRGFPMRPVLKLAPNCHMRPGPVTEEARFFAPWHSRAWTFQERLLSRRNLIFFRGSVIWQCKTSIWVEGVAGEPDGIAFDMDAWRTEQRRPAHLAFDNHFMFQLKTPKRPDFKHFEGLVRLYQRRKMTYQADGLRAFSGILDVLSGTYDGGFLHGMPKMFFDVAMLWAPLAGSKPRFVSPQSKGLLFPSWCWASFQGSVANGFSDHIFGNPSSIDLIPLVKWYNVGADGKASFVNLTQHLFRMIRQLGGLDGLDFSLFQPPTLDMSEIRLDKEKWDTLLHGSVMVASLRVVPREPERPLRISWEEEVAPFVDYHLTDASGKIVGRLKVPFTKEETPLQRDAVCKCIVISEGKAYYARSRALKEIYLPEWGLIEETRELEEFEFYNVWWVAWRDGIAYRRGNGTVWKEGWHRQNPEVRDIILG